MNDRVISRLTALGAMLFRINLSHTRLEDVAEVIRFVRSRTDVPLCLDTEGAQIRSGWLADGQMEVRENRLITAHARPVPGDPLNITLYPSYIVDKLVEGDFVSIDFDSVLAQVIEKLEDRVVMRVLNGGRIGSNKAVTVQRRIPMPPLTDKDVAAVKIGRETGIRHFALSFASCAADVDVLRDLAGLDTTIISKIESIPGLKDLQAIADHSDAVLIDRGDLSREMPIERIPATQKAIIHKVKAMNNKVYVATNLLESMIDAPTPTRAEVNDIYNTLRDGADGLVLAAETAIGAHPVACANMVVKLIHEYEAEARGAALTEASEPVSLLVEPHGGHLIQRFASESDRRDAAALPRLVVGVDELTDVEQIARGTYSPLAGFMTRETLDSVLDAYRLPSGAVWPMPIVLPVQPDIAASVSPDQRYVLTDENGFVHSLLDVSQVYEIELEVVAQKWFGTTSELHPGVARFKARGRHFVAGDVLLIEQLPSDYRRYDLSPAQTRFIFSHKGWSRVVGFHTRNVVHRAHEHIQLAALDRTHADGLFISPVVGRRKSGDFLPNLVLDCYQAMLDFALYSPGKVVLGSFQTWPRYCGPREAVFTALCRKNMGCSHFIIGRDHTGVGDFYGPDDNAALFEKLGEIDIKPLFFDEVRYDPEQKTHVFESDGHTEAISGTGIRKALAESRALPEWLVRGVVQDVIKTELAAGRPIFQE